HRHRFFGDVVGEVELSLRGQSLRRRPAGQGGLQGRERFVILAGGGQRPAERGPCLSGGGRQGGGAPALLDGLPGTAGGQQLPSQHQAQHRITGPPLGGGAEGIDWLALVTPAAGRRQR